jgi:hypothetical protein
LLLLTAGNYEFEPMWERITATSGVSKASP